MNFKLSICGLVAAFIFLFSHSYAQDWSNIPSVSGTSSHWEQTPKIRKYPVSKPGWKRNNWHNRTRSWKHRPKHRKRQIGIYYPMYWGYSELGYQSIDRESVQKQVIEWEPSDTNEESESLPEEKKEFAKPKIETIGEKVELNAESVNQSFPQKSEGITIIGSEGSFRIEKDVRVKSLIAPVGLIKIYSSD